MDLKNLQKELKKIDNGLNIMMAVLIQSMIFPLKNTMKKIV